MAPSTNDAVIHRDASWPPPGTADVPLYLHPAISDFAVLGSDLVVESIDASGKRHTVTHSVAETVSVAADPSPPARTALPGELVLAKERYGK